MVLLTDNSNLDVTVIKRSEGYIYPFDSKQEELNKKELSSSCILTQKNTLSQLPFHSLLLCSGAFLFTQFRDLKPRPNDRNISAQHNPPLLAQHFQAPAERAQHIATLLNATYYACLATLHSRPQSPRSF